MQPTFKNMLFHPKKKKKLYYVISQFIYILLGNGPNYPSKCILQVDNQHCTWHRNSFLFSRMNHENNRNIDPKKNALNPEQPHSLAFTSTEKYFVFNAWFIKSSPTTDQFDDSVI